MVRAPSWRNEGIGQGESLILLAGTYIVVYTYIINAFPIDYIGNHGLTCRDGLFK
jgi:hypothetical protein